MKPISHVLVRVPTTFLRTREAFLKGLESLSLKYQIDLPKGAAQGIIQAVGEFVRRHGEAKLKEAAKLHFATTGQVLS